MQPFSLLRSARKLSAAFALKELCPKANLKQHLLPDNIIEGDESEGPLTPSSPGLS